MSNAAGEPSQSGRALLVAMTIVLLTVLTIVAVGSLRWALQSQLVFGPTPTPTASPRATWTATPDIRSTRLAQNVEAQATYLAQIGFVTPAVELTLTAQVVMLPIAAAGPDATAAPPTVTPTPAPADVLLPVVIAGQETQPPESAGGDPPPGGSDPAVESTPTATPVVISQPATPTLPPAPSPTPSPTFSPTPFTVGEMIARIVTTPDTSALTYDGPSVRYDELTPIPHNTEIRLRGRTDNGEWVYACCTGDNQSFWIRQVLAPPTDNDFYDILPTETPSDNVRWLAVEPTQAAPTPIVTPTLIPASDYPLARRDPANHARVDQLPQPPMNTFWQKGVAPDSLVSQPIVEGNNVFTASQDRHLYSLDRQGGNQRWRAAINESSKHPVAVANGQVFLIDDAGMVYQWRISEEASLIQRQLSPPCAGLNLVDKYVIAAVDGIGDSSDQIILMDRESGDLSLNGAIADIEGNQLQYPAVGGQLVFAGNTNVHALDVFGNLAPVWTYDAPARITAPPVYAMPGIQALAELYIADDAGNVEALDANTGRRLWTRSNGGRVVTGMALDETRLYISGAGFAGAIQRDDPEKGWLVDISGAASSGPIVGPDALLVMTATGDINFLQKADGGVISTIREASGRGGQVTAAGVVGGSWIYQPVYESSNSDENKGRLYGWQGGE